MRKVLFTLFSLAFSSNLSAFELQGVNAAGITAASLTTVLPAPLPASYQKTKAAQEKAASSYAAYQVNGMEVAVPHIGRGYALLAAVNPRESAVAENKLRQAFSAPASARLQALQPASAAELEFAARNPGAAIYSVNQFLPANAAALFNREPNFAGPNCFNAALTAAGMMKPGELRHVGNPEADQLLAMYYKKVPASGPQPGDILVLNGGDHGVFYLGAGLIFHKKSYLKQHIYRIVQLEKAYAPEPFEWKPGPFDSGSPFNGDAAITRRDAWRPSGAQYGFGQATADEQAKAETILFLETQVRTQAARWALAKELGYFTERLLENLVSDWSAMAKSGNPVLKAYYHKLESLRDQANQSIELELLSSPHAQANANEILKRVWLPRNDYSRGLTGRLLKIYGRDAAETEKVLNAIEKDFDQSPLPHIQNGGI